MGREGDDSRFGMVTPIDEDTIIWRTQLPRTDALDRAVGLFEVLGAPPGMVGDLGSARAEQIWRGEHLQTALAHSALNESASIVFGPIYDFERIAPETADRDKAARFAEYHAACNGQTGTSRVDGFAVDDGTLVYVVRVGEQDGACSKPDDYHLDAITLSLVKAQPSCATASS